MRALLAALLAILALPASAANLAVNLSGQSGPAFATQLQSTDVQVARFVLQASSGDVTVDAINLHFSNAANADEAFTGVRLFYDADGNNIFDTSEELDASHAPNGTDDFLTFTETFTAVSGQIRELQVRATVSANVAAYGQAFQFRIDGAGSIALANGADTISGTLPAQAGAITIRHSQNRLQPGTGNPTQPRETFFGRDNVAALHFLVESLSATAPGQLAGIDLSSFTISVTLATNAQTEAITRVSLWQDDGDAAFEPGSGEVLIQARNPADVGKWGIAGSVISVVFDGTPIQNLQDVAAGQVRAFWIGIDFADDGPEAVCEVSLNSGGVQGALGPAADFMIANPALVSGNVLTLTEKPPKPKSREAQGEGGCSAYGWVQFNVPMLAVAAMLLFVRSRRKRTLISQKHYVDGLFGR
jgi:hypothetical protein